MAKPPNFEALYRSDADPFRVRASWYERRKLAVLLASLSQASYATGWDAACGTGDLALALASRCDHVWATDLSETAARITGELIAGHPNVDVAQSSLPAAPVMESAPDLIVLAEVLYYLPGPVRAQTCSMVDACADHLGRAEIASVHWRHHPEDTYLSGAAVTDELGGALVGRGWVAAVRHDDPDFVLATWTRDAEGVR